MLAVGAIRGFVCLVPRVAPAFGRSRRPSYAIGEVTSLHKYPVGLLETADARPGVLHALTGVIAQHRGDIAAVEILVNEPPESRTYLEKEGIMVISLNRTGSVPAAADLVVTDPIQAGVMAVMAVAKTARFDLDRLKRRIV